MLLRGCWTCHCWIGNSNWTCHCWICNSNVWTHQDHSKGEGLTTTCSLRVYNSHFQLFVKGVQEESEVVEPETNEPEVEPVEPEERTEELLLIDFGCACQEEWEVVCNVCKDQLKTEERKVKKDIRRRKRIVKPIHPIMNYYSAIYEADELDTLDCI